MYYIQDAHSFWDWIYFVALIIVSAMLHRLSLGLLLALPTRISSNMSE